MRESLWYPVHVCYFCNKRLTEDERRYNNSVCPKCGNISKGTICKTNKIVLKEIKHHKWWEFWNRKYSYIGKDEFSKCWLDTENINT